MENLKLYLHFTGDSFKMSFEKQAEEYFCSSRRGNLLNLLNSVSGLTTEHPAADPDAEITQDKSALNL